MITKDEQQLEIFQLRTLNSELADALKALSRYVRPLIAYEGSELITGKYLLEIADGALRKAGRE